jgi:hypothetical protein
MRAWFAGVVLLAAARVHAEPAHLTAALDVKRAPGAEQCLDAPTLAKAVDTRLGRAAFSGASPELQVTVELERLPDGVWRAQLLLEDAKGRALGRRELVSAEPACAALDPSLALVVALLVDAPPTPLVEPPPPTDTTTPLPPRPSALPPPTPIRIPKAPAPPEEPWRLGASLSAAASLGWLPAFAPGASLALSAEPPRLPELVAFAQLFAPRRKEFPDGSGVEVSLMRVGLAVCPSLYRGTSLRLAACVGQTVGRVGATAFGFDENRRTADLGYAVEVGGLFQVSLVGPLVFRAFSGVEMPLTRNVYVSGPERAVIFRSSPVAARGEMGLGVEL